MRFEQIVNIYQLGMLVQIALLLEYPPVATQWVIIQFLAGKGMLSNMRLLVTNIGWHEIVCLYEVE